jgi:hypothetical protein
VTAEIALVPDAEDFTVAVEPDFVPVVAATSVFFFALVVLAVVEAEVDFDLDAVEPESAAVDFDFVLDAVAAAVAVFAVVFEAVADFSVLLEEAVDPDFDFETLAVLLAVVEVVDFFAEEALAAVEVRELVVFDGAVVDFGLEAVDAIGFACAAGGR